MCVCVCMYYYIMQGQGLSNQPQIGVPALRVSSMAMSVLLRLESYWISGNSQSFSRPTPGFKLLVGAHQASKAKAENPRPKTLIHLPREINPITTLTLLGCELSFRGQRGQTREEESGRDLGLLRPWLTYQIPAFHALYGWKILYKYIPLLYMLLQEKEKKKNYCTFYLDRICSVA